MIKQLKKTPDKALQESIKEMALQNVEKGKREAELVIANKELFFQNKEKEKRAAELVIANGELAFQNHEKQKRADELIIANKELAFQNKEKENRASELIIANKKLIFQNKEKEKRAAELMIANKELAFQNEEKEKRASELIVANRELLFQNKEKEKRAAELIIANKELAFQNEEKEKRASELIVANRELLFQNKEKEKRAAELMIANKELAFQKEEKEKLASELIVANKELESFSYSVSHDLRAPLRAVNGFAILLEEGYSKLFDQEGRRLLHIVQENANKMGVLIDDLLAFSRLGKKEINKSRIDMTELAENVLNEFKISLQLKAEVHIHALHPVTADTTLMNQVWVNLLSNAIKYSSNTRKPVITISSEQQNGELIYSIKDNGVGFSMRYAHKLFGVFQRLHDAEDFEGTGVGLALVHRIISRHGGRIWAKAKVGKGATFYFSLPEKTIN
jgi:signal transduction histidine kinase